MEKTLKCIAFLLVLSLTACKKEPEVDRYREPASVKNTDTILPPKEPENSRKGFSNLRFRDVRVANIAPGMFRIKGRGQIFEANFSWVVEDGHNELASGNQMTDAGAPEWGNFDFTIDVGKDRPNSTLTLILFEISAKDGSRQHELAIQLPE